MDKMDNGHRGHLKNAFLSPTHFGKEGKQGFAGEAVVPPLFLLWYFAIVWLHISPVPFTSR